MPALGSYTIIKAVAHVNRDGGQENGNCYNGVLDLVPNLRPLGREKTYLEA